MTEEDPQQTAREEVQRARDALAKQQYVKAAMHAADALTFDPNNREYLDVADDVIAAVDDPLGLVPVQTGQVNFATAALRARILMTQRRLPEALSLIAEVVRIRPDVAYFDWARRWLQPHIIQAIPFQQLAGSVINAAVQVTGSVPVPMADDDPRRQNLLAARDFIAAIAQHHPGEAMPPFVLAMICRRLGQFDEAIRFANEAHRLKPDWQSCIGIACAQRDAGRVDDAVASFSHALQYDPEDLSARLDAGDTLLAAQRWDEAVRWYDDVLQRQPNHPWATASRHFALMRGHDSGQDRFALYAMREIFGNDRATALLDELDPPRAYVNYLPGPGDATANAVGNMLRDIAGKPEADGGSAKLTVTHPESPSVITAFQLGVRTLGKNIGLDIEVEKVQQPDPRQPKSQVDFVLWNYDGTTPRPVMGPADPRAQQPVAELAMLPFHPDYWEPKAREIGAQMGPGWMNALLAVMTDPPPIGDGPWDALTWLGRVQVATALVLSHLDQGWEGSARKRALYSLVLGPVDWTVDAGIIAMAWRAREDAAIRADVEQLFGWLETQIPKEGFTCFEYPLAASWLGMGGHSPETQARLEQWIERIHTVNQGQNRAGGEETRFEGLTLEQYAEFCVERDKHIGPIGVGEAVSSLVGGGNMDQVAAVCHRYGIELKTGMYGTTGYGAAVVPEWEDVIANDPSARNAFEEFKERARLKAQGIDPDGEEAQAVRNIREGKMDMHQEMAKAQEAQTALAEGNAGDPDPVVFPGQPVAKLSDYVTMLKLMQGGDFNGALARYGLDMMTYSQVAQAWGVKLAADPTLNAKFAQMMG